MNMVLEMGLKGGGRCLEIGAAGCGAFLRPSRADLVCGIGCTESVNISGLPGNISGCLDASL